MDQESDGKQVKKKLKIDEEKSFAYFWDKIDEHNGQGVINKDKTERADDRGNFKLYAHHDN